MDWKVFGTAFAAVFLAELADKTQVVGLGLTAKTQKPLPVFAGSIAAYAVVTLLTVMIGVAFGKYLKPEWIRYASGTIFIVMGVLFLTNRL